MSPSPPVRLATLCALLALALTMSCAVAQAHPQRKGGHRLNPRIGLASARAVGGIRCPAGSRVKRVSVRRRCKPSGSKASAALPIYWGATIGPQLTGTQAPWDMSAATKFEGLAQKPVSTINFFQPFSNCASTPCSFYRFPAMPMENIRKHGSIPFLSWGSESIPAHRDEPEFQLADITGGAYDTFLRAFAEEARAWGHPFFLRFDWEMNGNWFPWGEGVNGNEPGQFVAAWRHVHDIFASVGATNVTWVWCPYVDPANKMPSLASLYPGDAYVDWTGLDGYNWGNNPSSARGWHSFGELFRSTYRQVTESVAPTKPMILSEFGSSEFGGSKSAWIAEALAQIPAEYPKIRGALWFDTVADGMDWPIETSSTATGAFAGGIANPAYLSNTYAELPPGPIQPAS